MKELMQAGAIGEVVLARVNHTASYDPSSHEWGAWRTDPEISGGGVLMDLGSHRIDLLMYLLGDVVAVSGTLKTFTCPIRLMILPSLPYALKMGHMPSRISTGMLACRLTKLRYTVRKGVYVVIRSTAET